MSWHKKQLQQQLLLHLTFILFISHFHIFFIHIPHKIPIHTSHAPLNSMSLKVYIYIYIYIKDPCPTKYLHIIPIHITNIISHNIYIFLIISTHLKIYQTLFQELITKSTFLWKAKTYKIKSPSCGRQYHSYLIKN